MKRLVFVLLALGACEGSDNVGTQCHDINLSCTSDQSCANYPGSTCGQNGVCSVCGDAPDAAPPNPDATTACTEPPQIVTCQPGTVDCSNYPGTVCTTTGTCSCPTACTPPQQTVTCVPGTQDACANYPGTTCMSNGGATATCSCPTTCTPPPQAVSCTPGTVDCGNYPGTVCGPNNICVCP